MIATMMARRVWSRVRSRSQGTKPELELLVVANCENEEFDAGREEV